MLTKKPITLKKNPENDYKYDTRTGHLITKRESSRLKGKKESTISLKSKKSESKVKLPVSEPYILKKVQNPPPVRDGQKKKFTLPQHEPPNPKFVELEKAKPAEIKKV